MISLLLVEDNPIFGEALVHTLQRKDDLRVVTVVRTAEEALEVIPHLTIDLVLVDVFLPGMNGIELVSELQQAYPNIPCLIISGNNFGYVVQRSLRAGARGYALKDSAAGIIEAIRFVLNGETYVSKEIHGFTLS
jgi:DNA-binding NarL/FixJ family response regulator